MTTFHLTTCDLHGGLTLRAGDVIRVLDGAFGDAVVLGFNSRGDAKVARPYAYASGVGTSGPTALMGAETYELTASNLAAVIAQRPRIDEGRLT